MGVWDLVKGWFKTEATDLKEVAADVEQQLDADLTRRERELDETPQEAVERLQAEAESDTTFAAISDKIDAAVARAAAAAETQPTEDGPDVDPEFLDRE